MKLSEIDLIIVSSIVQTDTWNKCWKQVGEQTNRPRVSYDCQAIWVVNRKIYDPADVFIRRQVINAIRTTLYETFNY